MTRPVGPVGSTDPTGASPSVPDARDINAADRRAVDRRKAERRSPSRRKTKEAGSDPGRDLVPVGPSVSHDPAPTTPRPAHPAAAEAAFAAQMMGQTGQKRGLRGGPPVLDAARSTYLNAEFTGEKDRRPPVGNTRKTDI